MIDTKKLIGRKIIKIECGCVYGDYFSIVTFDNGLHLTAIDGEYGCDTFEILSKKEYKEIEKEPIENLENKIFIKSYKFTKKEIELFLKDMNDKNMKEIIIPVLEERRIN